MGISSLSSPEPRWMKTSIYGVNVKESGTKNIRTLHRNMLFPLSSKQYENVLEQNSRIEALAKSNILMAKHFNQD